MVFLILKIPQKVESENVKDLEENGLVLMFILMLAMILCQFWVRIRDAQDELGIKNISDMVRKEIHGIFETKNPTKYRMKKCKRSGREWFNVDVYTYVRSDFISRIIKNCRSEKGTGE